VWQGAIEMSKTWIINTDEELFNRFKETSNELQTLSCFFQNSNTIVNNEEMTEWNKLSMSFMEKVSQLIYECDSRFELTEEDKRKLWKNYKEESTS
jgi:hypothetical protein